MGRTVDRGPTDPEVWLHPHRRVGVCYGAVAAVLLVVVVLAVTANLGDGESLFALATAVGGLGVIGFLTILTLALLVPGLRMRAAGVSGWVTVGRPVDVGWSEVSIDVSEDAPPGRLRLDIADRSVEVDVRSWVGFRDFVLLVASTPEPARRLTPAARREVARLLGLDQTA